jgi:hypothetical protein
MYYIIIYVLHYYSSSPDFLQLEKLNNMKLGQQRMQLKQFTNVEKILNAKKC